jgi:hypothetical protein
MRDRINMFAKAELGLPSAHDPQIITEQVACQPSDALKSLKLRASRGDGNVESVN